MVLEEEGTVRDGNGSSFVKHDPWSLSYAWDKEGAWHGGAGQPSWSSEQKNRRSKLSPQL